MKMENIVRAMRILHEQDAADGCLGCAFEDVDEWNMPCVKCKRNCKDYWRAKKEQNDE